MDHASIRNVNVGGSICCGEAGAQILDKAYLIIYVPILT